MPSLSTRQSAAAFNQPLSLDTSKVTTMSYMFSVRSEPCPAPDPQLGPRLHAACVAATSRPPASQPACHPRRMPSLSTWQYATAFNQSLSFDTSKVTTMENMFYVRSAPCPAPDPQLGPRLHAACVAATQRPPASQPAWRPRRVLSLSTRQVAAVNQPLSFDTSIVTNFMFMFGPRYVRFAPCPAPDRQSGCRLHAACAVPRFPGPRLPRLPHRLLSPPFRLDRAFRDCLQKISSSFIALGLAIAIGPMRMVRVGLVASRARRPCRRPRRRRPRRRPRRRRRFLPTRQATT